MKSDAQLQTDVLEELAWEPSVNAARIGVEVNNGVVTLAGHVNSYAEKCNAEHAAQRVAGVIALAVEMQVNLPGDNKRSDADIARTAENAVRWLTLVPADTVKIMVENGWVTLSGEVEWAFQRNTATSAVRHLMGVTGVSDQITIKPKPSLTAIQSDIEAALKRRAASDAHEIHVEVRGSDVILTGTVHSWSERDLATHTAWSTPGVRNVADKMSVTY